MGFRDLDEFLTEQPIELPIRGKVYRFPGSIPARTGLLLQRLAAAAARAPEGTDQTAATEMAAEVLSDSEELDLRAEVMGDAEAEMADDGLSTAHTAHVFRTLMVWHMVGQGAAEKAWEQLGPPPAPNRAARRTVSSVSATSTRSPASTTRTSTRGSAPKATRVAARRGPLSSPSGD